MKAPSLVSSETTLHESSCHQHLNQTRSICSLPLRSIRFSMEPFAHKGVVKIGPLSSSGAGSRRLSPLLLRVECMRIGQPLTEKVVNIQPRVGTEHHFAQLPDSTKTTQLHAACPSGNRRARSAWARPHHCVLFPASVKSYDCLLQHAPYDLSLPSGQNSGKNGFRRCAAAIVRERRRT